MILLTGLSSPRPEPRTPYWLWLTVQYEIIPHRRNWEWLLVQLISEEMMDFGIPN